MESELRILRVDTKQYKAGTIVEIYTICTETNKIDNVLITCEIQGITANTLEHLEIASNEYDEYFEFSQGLSKVYKEYKSKVSQDILKDGNKSVKNRMTYALITIVIALTLICLAASLSGTLSKILALLSMLCTIMFLAITFKRKVSSNIEKCKQTRKMELLHMLKNLGYIK